MATGNVKLVSQAKGDSDATIFTERFQQIQVCVGVLVDATQPRAVRISEVDLDAGDNCSDLGKRRRSHLSKRGVDMDMPSARRVQKRASAMWYAASTVGTGVPANGEASKLLVVPNQGVTVGLPQPASGIYKFTAEENARFLRLVSACAQVTSHYELFLLVQGELQFFLPHDILIAAWGDFRAQDPQVDVISNLPGVRTDRVCNSIVPLAKRLHKIWIDGGSQPIVLNKRVAELRACNNDACALPCAFPDTRLTLVHGTCNKRDGYDSLYIALRRRPFTTNGAEARLCFLADSVIHQIDVAYRKVVALHTANAPCDERPPSSPLSVREEEITYWVCQGKTNGQIAHTLGISVNTVRNHVHRIFDKLGANNRTHAVVKYRDMAGSAELLTSQ